MAEIFGLSTRRPRKRLKPASFSVERFGSVSNATIELADFILLVGRNNTGKSYIANLIWAFRNFRSVFSYRTHGNEIKPPIWLSDFLANAEPDAPPLHITGADVAAYLNEWLKDNEQFLADKILSYEGSKIKGLRLSFSGGIWLWRRSKPSEIFGDTGRYREASFWEISFSANDEARQPSSGYAQEGIWGGGIEIDTAIFNEIIEIFISGARSFQGYSTYLPAARSGLMLALPSLYASLLEDLGQIGADTQTGELPLATARFLRSMTQRHRSASPSRQHVEIAEFLEREVLKGTISRADDAAGRFTYAPKGTQESLPLYVTSSLVSEIAPLLYLLRTGRLYGGIVFEEPEAHLHLSAQRAMARAVARFLNTGSPVALTTHSDTFIQQINVLGRLHEREDKEKLLDEYSYDENDTIDFSKSVAYEFNQTRTGTKIRKIRPSIGGYAIESLNETIIELAKEAVATSSDSD